MLKNHSFERIALLSLGCALGCAAPIATATASTFSDALSAVIDTTPAGLVRPSAERDGSWDGFWEDTKRGSEAIMRDGKTMLVLPTYTNHPRWEWEDKDEENGYPFGMGLARQVIDDRGNERLFFLVNFVDSNYRLEPMVGYSWVARYPIAQTGWHYGAGYLAGITIRGDYSYIPCPLPLPVAKIGNDTFSFYGTFIPFTNVFFFYSSITIDDTKSRKMPLPATSSWSRNTDFIYGGYGITRTDNGEEESPTRVDSDTSWHVGWRHYSGRCWATDLSYRKSSHAVTRAEGPGNYDLDIEMLALQLQYNIDAFDSLRLYAGGGLGYSRAENSQGDDDDSIHPVLSLGATYSVTDHLYVDASITTSFARFTGVAEDRHDKYVIRAMPVDLSVSVGFAF